MRKALILGILTLLGAGTASAQVFWTKPGQTQETFDQDKAQCLSGLDFYDCMRGRGWTIAGQGPVYVPPPVNLGTQFGRGMLEGLQRSQPAPGVNCHSYKIGNYWNTECH